MPWACFSLDVFIFVYIYPESLPNLKPLPNLPLIEISPGALNENFYDDTLKFIKFQEPKLQLKSSDELISDLIKFQIFLLTTRTDSKIKNETFIFDWKNFFVNKSKLSKTEKNYFYKNPILENEKILWGYKTIWYGRQSMNYKFHPENLQEKESIIVEN